MEMAALNRRVEAPGEKRAIGVGHGPVQLAQTLENLGARRQSPVDPVGPRRVDRADIVEPQIRARTAEMGVRVDEPRQDDLVGEGVVDLVSEAVEPRLHRFERADRDDPPVLDRDRLGHRPAGIHRDDLAPREDRQIGHAFALLLNR